MIIRESVWRRYNGFDEYVWQGEKFIKISFSKTKKNENDWSSFCAGGSVIIELAAAAIPPTPSGLINRLDDNNLLD